MYHSTIRHFELTSFQVPCKVSPSYFSLYIHIHISMYPLHLSIFNLFRYLCAGTRMEMQHDPEAIHIDESIYIMSSTMSSA